MVKLLLLDCIHSLWEIVISPFSQGYGIYIYMCFVYIYIHSLCLDSRYSMDDHKPYTMFDHGTYTVTISN